MRALSFAISTDTGAGGFILPNDRVDVVLTMKIGENPARYRATTILDNVRVLAMDQTFKEDKDQKVVIAKTATVEVSPDQAELLAKSQATGTISLALRALGDADPKNKLTVASNNRPRTTGGGQDGSAVMVIRYGVDHAAGGSN
jgi:pilus assembly protein CpaB